MKKSQIVKAALAGLFAASLPAFAADAAKPAKTPAKKAATVQCLGVNACKGTSECAVKGGAACKGQNACKGKGWTPLTKKECKKQKGTVQAANKTETAPAATPAAK